MTDYVGLLASVDLLYEGVVLQPEAWTDQALADWAEERSSEVGTLSPWVAREIRRVLRSARKLRDYWHDPDQVRPTDAGDWRTRVDLVMGPKAWRPCLDIARAGLEDCASADLYDEVKLRFRDALGERWMDGVSFEEWRDER